MIYPKLFASIPTRKGNWTKFPDEAESAMIEPRTKIPTTKGKVMSSPARFLIQFANAEWQGKASNKVNR